MTFPSRDTKHHSSTDTSRPPQLLTSTSISGRPADNLAFESPRQSPGTVNKRRDVAPGEPACRLLGPGPRAAVAAAATGSPPRNHPRCDLAENRLVDHRSLA